MDGEIIKPSIDLNIVVTIVNNIATVYRVAFNAPGSGSEAGNQWNTVVSYDDCRKLKQELKRDGIRMKSPFPNASVVKTITEEDLVPLTAVRACDGDCFVVSKLALLHVCLSVCLFVCLSIIFVGVVNL
jgi:hypothetical protein